MDLCSITFCTFFTGSSTRHWISSSSSSSSDGSFISATLTLNWTATFLSSFWGSASGVVSLSLDGAFLYFFDGLLLFKEFVLLLLWLSFSISCISWRAWSISSLNFFSRSLSFFFFEFRLFMEFLFSKDFVLSTVSSDLNEFSFESFAETSFSGVFLGVVGVSIVLVLSSSFSGDWFSFSLLPSSEGERGPFFFFDDLLERLLLKTRPGISGFGTGSASSTLRAGWTNSMTCGATFSLDSTAGLGLNTSRSLCAPLESMFA